jgi:hypothetical protein
MKFYIMILIPVSLFGKKQVARHIKVGDIAGCDAHGYIRIGYMVNYIMPND